MSRKNFGAKAYSYPQPVFIIATYDENGNPNAMNAAWGGISEEKEVSVCLSPNHKTCKNFAVTGAFTISMADAQQFCCLLKFVIRQREQRSLFRNLPRNALMQLMLQDAIMLELLLAITLRINLQKPDSLPQKVNW